MSVEILGLGASAMDIVMQCENLPKEDGFSFIHCEKLMPGGSCANVLVTLSNMDIRTSLVAQLGDDHYGGLFLEDIKLSGVETEYVKVKQGGESLHTFITVDKKGDKAIYCNLGDSLLELGADDVGSEMLKGIKLFYTDMFPVKPAIKLARLCKEEGIPVAVNLQCAPSFMSLCNASSQELEEMFSLADVIFACREGLLELAGSDDYLSAGNSIYDKYRPKYGLVFTLGENGALVFGEEGLAEIPAIDIEAVDTTGAGDSFIGGFIYAFFISKMTAADSARFANACAAIKCTQRGPRLKASKEDILEVLSREA
ncbi:MAG: carbohydrate kinase family protein [Peptoclostridium sp.]|uniref:carbohydrate kinase family protein n=1 Tax=Peptoclostridium sp. TaxID=1904860 RepID=UPI00139CD65D|nr:carbohydrate kinase family protein [Peptoclostridium sp.]MZQ75877.1 carbohydrate kinase family protein [Peptoclostridium sp.]